MHTEYSDRYITMGLKIAYYRKKAGFTQEILAEKIGKSVNFLSQIVGSIISTHFQPMPRLLYRSVTFSRSFLRLTAGFF